MMMWLMDTLFVIVYVVSDFVDTGFEDRGSEIIHCITIS
jgi:hypothetical protein